MKTLNISNSNFCHLCMITLPCRENFLKHLQVHDDGFDQDPHNLICRNPKCEKAAVYISSRKVSMTNSILTTYSWSYILKFFYKCHGSGSIGTVIFYLPGSGSIGTIIFYLSGSGSAKIFGSWWTIFNQNIEFFVCVYELVMMPWCIGRLDCIF